MGKAFLAAVVGFPLSLFLAIASMELANVEPSLARRLMYAAMAVAVLVAGMRVVVWRRDSRQIASAKAADAGTLPSEPTLAFEESEDAPERSPYPYVDATRDTFGTEVVIAAAPAASWVERLEAYEAPAVEIEGHAHVLDFAPEPAGEQVEATRRPLLHRLRRAERSREETAAGELIVDSIPLALTRLDTTPREEVDEPADGLLDTWLAMPGDSSRAS